MTTTQRDAIATPATGLKVYNTTTNTTDTYDGATWQRFGQQTFIKGSGTTFATTSLLVQDSSGTQLLKVRDDGQITCAGAIQAAGFVGTAYGNFGSLSYDPSVVLGAQSTSAGFLPPRMTQAQILAIATPATGLMAYNLDIGQVCVFDGAIWHKLNQSPM
jgi:hypothetical protein